MFNFEVVIFDVVIFFFNGLMFILDERECIKVLLEIYWVLKEGGLFIFIMYDRE